MGFCQNCGHGLPENSSSCAFCVTCAPSVAAVAAPAPAASGLRPNVAPALTYLAGFITGVIFLLIDPFKTDRFVRFHAFQSIFFNVAWIGFWILWAIAGMILEAFAFGRFSCTARHRAKPSSSPFSAHLPQSRLVSDEHGEKAFTLVDAAVAS